jgi:HD-GYP domain-containing protein (c-di-GMP phosphodiesterase class II)
LSVLLGKSIGLSRVDMMDLKTASLLHDIGKGGIPDAILTKPGKLNAAEYEQIKKHPAEGARIIGLVKELSGLVLAIRHHHERWDGGGYPDGLLGEQIPQMARIITIADSYDAITSARTYKDAMSGATAIREIEAGSGSQFDPELAGVFIGIISQPENS